MKKTFVTIAAGWMTPVMLLCSGWASGQGIAAAIGIDASWNNILAFVLFLIVGFGVSVTSLHLIGLWDENRNPLDLLFALLLSTTTIMGFLTQSIGAVQESIFSKSAIEAAKDHYYGLQASYNQLRIAQRMKERLEMEPKLDEAKRQYLSLLSQEGAQASSLTAYHDIARAFGFSNMETWWAILFFFGVTIEGSMHRSFLSTREGKKLLTVDKTTRKAVDKTAPKPVSTVVNGSPIKVDNEKAARIVNLWNSGVKNQSEIARRLSVSRQYVNHVLRSCDEPL